MPGSQIALCPAGARAVAGSIQRGQREIVRRTEDVGGWEFTETTESSWRLESQVPRPLGGDQEGRLVEKCGRSWLSQGTQRTQGSARCSKEPMKLRISKAPGNMGARTRRRSREFRVP